MRCTSQPVAAMPQLHLWAIIGSGYQPAMRAAFLAAVVHGTHATATFSKRRLLLLLLLILITGVNAGANEMH